MRFYVDMAVPTAFSSVFQRIQNLNQTLSSGKSETPEEHAQRSPHALQAFNAECAFVCQTAYKTGSWLTQGLVFKGWWSGNEVRRINHEKALEFVLETLEQSRPGIGPMSDYFVEPLIFAGKV